MKLYAERDPLRLRQIATDTLIAAWVYVWVRVGMTVHDLVARLSAAGETMEAAGNRFAGVVTTAADEAVDIPLIGEQLRRPFDAVASAGRTLEQAGQTQQEAVLTLALWLGTALAVVPIVVVLLRWLPARLSWIAEAGAAAKIRRTPDALYLFALRAAATRPLHEVRRAEPNPGAALARGDYDRLADLELSALGLRRAERTSG